MDKRLIGGLDRLFLVVTGACNAQCKLCNYWKQQPGKFLSPRAVRQKAVPIISRYNIQLTLVTGGEPTLHPRLPEILRELKQTGTQTSLITNGSRLANLFEQVKHYTDAYMFSLDASNEKLYREIRGLDNFNDIVAWPGKIKASQPHAQVALACLVQKKNAADLVNLYLLAADLPVDVIFFNVPELKPHCFGRQGKVPPQSMENVLLNSEEAALLEENLEKIVQLDSSRGKLFQGEMFFANCVRYFRALASGGKVEFNPPHEVCQVPFTSIVFDEFEAIHPCFYLPFSVPFGAGETGELDGDYLKNIRGDLANDPGFRREHCSFCLQFQG
jgi:MoaA/NifB/PqqE/SkfB family radical SAM enzyme